MSLTLTTAFTEKTVLKENWLFQLFYDDESATDFFGISYYDTTVESVDYKGCVLNKATIRESINLEKSTAKTSNVSLTISNFINSDGLHFSRAIYNSTNKYINRQVKIYIQPDDATAIADCVLIYTGRLEQLSHDQEKINLSIIAKRPWDKISIPSTKTSVTNKYFPVVYGAFTKNDTNASSQGFATSRELYPVSVDKKGGESIYCLSPRSYNSSTGHDARLHYYEKNLDVFIPIQLTTSTFTDSSESYQGGNAIRCSSDLSRSFKTKPINPSSDDQSTNPSNAYDQPYQDDLTGTFATLTNTISFSENASYEANDYLRLDPPNIVGKISELKIKIGYHKSYTDDHDGGSHTVQLIVGNSTTDLTGSGNSTAEVDVTSAYTNNNNQIPKIEVRDRLIYVAESGEFGNSVTTVKIFDVQIWVKVALDTSTTDTTEIAKSELDRLEEMYVGANGLISSIDGSHISQIHQAHYDLLRRFTSYGSVPTNYSTLNSARNWGIRYWITESTSLIDLLEKLQYEGGFIGRFNGQGNFQYIFIPDSPSASETLYKSDISDIKISLSPINNLITKMDIEYEKHPAEDKYLSNATSVSDSDADLLSLFNIASNENVEKVTLDAYVSPAINTTRGNASDKNDCFYRYYDHIVGKPRIIINFSIVNPKYLGLDVGDIIEVDLNSVVRPFGGTDWVGEDGDGYIFMITDVSRSVGSLKITAREI